ncbi:MAG: sigma factor [Pedobacter sp.]|uniref:RNA polymerase sigma factor n=1 Tax=Pedobacter sp. TaxID=1411316 RepID=UPI003393EF69
MNNTRLSTVELREAFFTALYKKTFPTVARYIARMGGTQTEAQDIFQDTLIIYYEKIAAQQTSNIINEQVYLLGIAQKLWFRHYKANSRNQALSDFDTVVLPDELPASEKILHYLGTAGKKCMELLKAYYYDRLPTEDVVKEFGYSGLHSATVAKYKCMEKVRDTVKRNSLYYADFIE